MKRAKTTTCPHCNGKHYDPPCKLCAGKHYVSIQAAEQYARQWFVNLIQRHAPDQSKVRVYRAILTERRNGLTFQQLRIALENSPQFIDGQGSPRYIPPEWVNGKTLFS